MVSAAALSARAVFSPSASSSAARPCWSWVRAATTSASHVDARERAPSRSSRARRSASSRSTNAVRTLSTTEAPSAAWAPCSGGRSSRTSALYASHRSGDLRASTRASRASYCPRYQWRSAPRRSRATYRSRAQCSSSCHQQAEREGRALEKSRAKRKKGKESRNFTKTQLTWKTRHAGPLWIHNASFSARLSESPWSRSSYQSPYSA
jgi:hypothetical protein